MNTTAFRTPAMTAVLAFATCVVSHSQAKILFNADFETRDLSQVQSAGSNEKAFVEVVRNPAGAGWVMRSSITPN